MSLRQQLRGYCALTVLLVVPAALAQTTLDERVPEIPDRVLTITKGLHSQFGDNAEAFDGADFVLRTPLQWRVFWKLHTGDPQAEPPVVDFERRVVLASIQGVQDSSGGPNITIADVQDAGPLRRIVVVNDRRAGPLDAPSNPFHVVSVARAALPENALAFFSRVPPLPGTATLQGRVVLEQPDGEFFARAGVTVTLAAGNDPSGSATTRTGRDGSYFFLNVPLGTYAARAAAPNHQPQLEVVALSEPGLTRVGFALLLEPGGIGGRVVTESAAGEQAPIAGALVTARRVTHEDEPDTWQTETGPQGGFVLDELPPGRYRLLVDASGFEPMITQLLVEPGKVTQRLVTLEVLR